MAGDTKITATAKKAPPERREGYHHGDLRQHLVEASRELIAANGMDRFSISAACRAAGVSTAAPYRHFADKEDLLIAVRIDGLQRMADAMAAHAEAKPRGTLAAIAAIGEGYVAFARAEPNMFRAIFDHTEDHANSCQVETAGNETYGVLLREVAHYLGRTEVDEVVHSVCFPLWTFVHGASCLAIDNMIDKAKVPIDIPTLISTATANLLAPHGTGA